MEDLRCLFSEYSASSLSGVERFIVLEVRATQLVYGSGCLLLLLPACWLLAVALIVSFRISDFHLDVSRL